MDQTVIKYYLYEGMTVIIPVSEEKSYPYVRDMEKWVTDKLLQAPQRILISQELQDKLSSLPFSDRMEIGSSMFDISYDVVEGEIQLVANIKNQPPLSIDTIKQIASMAWQGAAQGFRMYPDNKHTFVQYWIGAGQYFIKEFKP